MSPTLYSSLLKTCRLWSGSDAFYLISTSISPSQVLWNIKLTPARVQYGMGSYTRSKPWCEYECHTHGSLIIGCLNQNFCSMSTQITYSVLIGDEVLIDGILRRQWSYEHKTWPITITHGLQTVLIRSYHFKMYLSQRGQHYKRKMIAVNLMIMIMILFSSL